MYERQRKDRNVPWEALKGTMARWRNELEIDKDLKGLQDVAFSIFNVLKYVKVLELEIRAYERADKERRKQEREVQNELRVQSK